MDLSNAGAVYERKISYPTPVGKPGAPFADPILKLVVRSAPNDAGAIHLGPRQKLAAHLRGLDGSRYKHGEVLLRLPALKSLTCGRDTFDDARILPALRARGVAVRTMG